MTDQKDEKEYLTLSFDDGEDVEYEVLGVIDVEEKTYIVMVPETDQDSIEIFGLEDVDDDPETEEIIMIDDDEEYMKVVNALRDMGFSIEMDEQSLRKTVRRSKVKKEAPPPDLARCFFIAVLKARWPYRSSSSSSEPLKTSRSM